MSVAMYERVTSYIGMSYVTNESFTHSGMFQVIHAGMRHDTLVETWLIREMTEMTEMMMTHE